MKKAIVPPALLTVADSFPLRIIATKSSATVIKETESSFWSSAIIVSVNNKTNEINFKRPDSISSTDAEWYANYE